MGKKLTGKYLQTANETAQKMLDEGFSEQEITDFSKDYLNKFGVDEVLDVQTETVKKKETTTPTTPLQPKTEYPLASGLSSGSIPQLPTQSTPTVQSNGQSQKSSFWKDAITATKENIAQQGKVNRPIEKDIVTQNISGVKSPIEVASKPQKKAIKVNLNEQQQKEEDYKQSLRDKINSGIPLDIEETKYVKKAFGEIAPQIGSLSVAEINQGLFDANKKNTQQRRDELLKEHEFADVNNRIKNGEVSKEDLQIAQENGLIPPFLKSEQAEQLRVNWNADIKNAHAEIDNALSNNISSIVQNQQTENDRIDALKAGIRSENYYRKEDTPQRVAHIKDMGNELFQLETKRKREDDYLNSLVDNTIKESQRDIMMMGGFEFDKDNRGLLTEKGRAEVAKAVEDYVAKQPNSKKFLLTYKNSGGVKGNTYLEEVVARTAEILPKYFKNYYKSVDKISKDLPEEAKGLVKQVAGIEGGTFDNNFRPKLLNEQEKVSAVNTLKFMEMKGDVDEQNSKFEQVVNTPQVKSVLGEQLTELENKYNNKEIDGATFKNERLKLLYLNLQTKPLAEQYIQGVTSAQNNYEKEVNDYLKSIQPDFAKYTKVDNKGNIVSIAGMKPEKFASVMTELQNAKQGSEIKATGDVILEREARGNEAMGEPTDMKIIQQGFTSGLNNMYTARAKWLYDQTGIDFFNDARIGGEMVLNTVDQPNESTFAKDNFTLEAGDWMGALNPAYILHTASSSAPYMMEAMGTGIGIGGVAKNVLLEAGLGEGIALSRSGRLVQKAVAGASGGTQDAFSTMVSNYNDLVKEGYSIKDADRISKEAFAKEVVPDMIFSGIEMEGLFRATAKPTLKNVLKRTATTFLEQIPEGAQEAIQGYALEDAKGTKENIFNYALEDKDGFNNLMGGFAGGLGSGTVVSAVGLAKDTYGWNKLYNISTSDMQDAVRYSAVANMVNNPSDIKSQAALYMMKLSMDDYRKVYMETPQTDKLAKDKARQDYSNSLRTYAYAKEYNRQAQKSNVEDIHADYKAHNRAVANSYQKLADNAEEANKKTYQKQADHYTQLADKAEYGQQTPIYAFETNTGRVFITESTAKTLAEGSILDKNDKFNDAVKNGVITGIQVIDDSETNKRLTEKFAEAEKKKAPPVAPIISEEQENQIDNSNTTQGIGVIEDNGKFTVKNPNGIDETFDTRELADARALEIGTPKTENKAVENIIPIEDRKRKDLFPDESEFADVIGESGKNSNISSYREVNGIGISEYTNPDNGLVDVIMSGTSDNDYVGYVRIYENGKPTERWTSKMENKSGNKQNFKTMISEVQNLLPQGHEYTEKTNISLDGLRVYANQLKRGYEIATDENGDVITNNVELNNATLAALQGAKTESEVSSLYDKKTGITKEEFDVIKDKINSLIPNTRVLFNSSNGSVIIKLPVLKSKTENNATQNTQATSTESTAVNGQNEGQETTTTVTENVTEAEKSISAKLDGKDVTIQKTETGYTYTRPNGFEIEVTEDEHLQNIKDKLVIVNAEVGSKEATPTTSESGSPTTETAPKLSEKSGEIVTVNVGGKAITGTVEVDEGGKVSITSGNKTFELANDYPYADYASPVRVSDNGEGITVNGETYVEQRFETDAEGNEKVVLIKEDGTITTNTNPTIIEEIKYQTALQIMDEMSDEEAEQILKKHESKRPTKETTKEGVSKTDTGTSEKSEQEIRLQEAIEEIDLIENIALEELQNTETKAKLVEHENGKTYLVKKNDNGTFTATYNGRNVRKGNFLNNLIRQYEAQTKAESNALIPKLQEQVNNLKSEVEAKLFSIPLNIKENAIQEQATNESVLRTEQSEMGLQEVGKGNAKSESVTEQVKTTAKEEIVTPIKRITGNKDAVTLSGLTEVERQKQIAERDNSLKLSKEKEAESKLSEQVRKFNSMRRNDAKRPKLLNDIKKASLEQGFEVKYDGRGVEVFKKTKAGKKTKINSYLSDVGRRSTTNEKALHERSEAVQELYLKLMDLDIDLDARNSDDNSRFSESQIQSAITDIENGIPSRQANEILNKVEQLSETGFLDVGDKVSGYKSIPIDELISEAEELRNEQLFKDLTNDEVFDLYENEIIASNDNNNILKQEYERLNNEGDVPSTPEKITRESGSANEKIPTKKGTNKATSKPKKSISKEAFTALSNMLKKAFPKVKFIDEARAKEIIEKFGFDNISKMFIGNKNANLFSESFNGKTIGENFNFANELEAQGKSSDEIKFATGWFKVGDGKWRYEITDNEAKLKDKLPTKGEEVTTKLKYILDHPKLLELYPQLENSEITITNDNTNTTHGLHYKLGNKHYIVVNTTGDINQTISEILYEVQHAVQLESGLSVGANNNTIYQRKLEVFKDKFGRSPSTDESRTLAIEANREYKSAYGEIEAKATQDNAKQSEQQRIFDSTIEKTIKKYGINKDDITYRSLNDIQYLETPDGTIFGFQRGDEIFLDPELMNADTPIHEVVGHYGINIIDAQSRGGDAKATAVMLKGFALLKEPEGKAVLDEVQANPAYANLPLRKQKLEAVATIIGREGAGIFEEGTKDTNKSTPNILKVKSFKTDEGKFDIYDTEKDGARGRVDMFTILKDKNGWIVRNAFVPDNLQKQGIATDFYKRMNEESIKATGKPLRSTQERTLNNGEKVHELTANAIKLWDSLVRDGYAEKIGEKNYKFSKEQPTKPSKTFTQKVKDFINSFYEYLKSKIPTLKDKSIEDIGKMDNKEFIRAIIGDAFRGEIVADNETKNTDDVMLSATKEAEGITLTYNDKGQHLAPNGKPSNLTEQQAKIVRTEAFKSWFGDWENDPENASKVVDRNGEPLVVYHGSPSGDITQFDRNKSKTESSGLKEFGSWFTTNKKVAELYANKRLTDGVSGNAIYPVFLNLRNLPEFDAEGMNWYDAKRNIKANIGYKTAIGTDAIEAFAGKNTARPNVKTDGVKISNVIEGIGLDDSHTGDSFIVFDDTKNAIKLADGTNTTFNPNTNDIRFSIESNSSTPISDKNKKVIEGLVQDIKEGKRTEQEVRDLINDNPKSWVDKFTPYLDLQLSQLNDTEYQKALAKYDEIKAIKSEKVRKNELLKIINDNFDNITETLIKNNKIKRIC